MSARVENRRRKKGILEGRTAFWRGEMLEDCPYKTGGKWSISRAAWLIGWNQESKSSKNGFHLGQTIDQIRSTRTNQTP